MDIQKRGPALALVEVKFREGCLVEVTCKLSLKG